MLADRTTPADRRVPWVLVVGIVVSLASGGALLGALPGSGQGASAGSGQGSGQGASAGPVAEVAGAVETRAPDETAHGVPVVLVRARGCAGRTTGSGVLLDGGRVLTAAHVLDGADHAEIDRGDGVPIDATLVAVDPGGRDVALLWAAELDDPSLVAASIAEEPATADDTVRVIGHPYGGVRTEREGLVAGSLSSGPLALDGGRVVTLDFVVDEGMSGGPLVADDGAVAGVAIGVERNTRTGIAVPIEEIGDLLAMDESDRRSPTGACGG